MLTANECKALSKFQDEIAAVSDQAPFEIPFQNHRSQSEGVKIVRVLYQRLRKIGLRGGKSLIKIGKRVSLPVKESSLDLVNQDISTPAILHCLPDVPFSLIRVVYSVKNPDLMPPRQLCNNLLHKLLVRIGLGERPPGGPKSNPSWFP